MRILVADDSQTARMTMEKMLVDLGHDVVCAQHGYDAWGKFQRTYFHVVVSDWLMPEMDGLELCRRIRQANRQKYTHVILLTSLEGKKNYIEGMTAGADDFVTKPVDSEDLAVRLKVAERIVSLQTEITQMEMLLPICAYCKKIRDEQEQWSEIERYISARTDTSFTHGICPECRAKHFPESL